MRGVDSLVVARTGMPRRSASFRSSGAGASPFVTMKQEISQRTSRFRMAARFRGASFWR